MSKSEASKCIGIIVIGRNEGGHLKACLTSVCGDDRCVVYVDSGSTDDSVSIANNAGVEVVELDSNRPYTAARGRNEGVKYLKVAAPECDIVQFVDGDCVIETGWLGSAQQFLADNPDTTIVCGRLQERFPERTVYNYLCDIEWDGPEGAIRACGGIFMMRVMEFHAIGGFRDDLKAGEEPELCLRVRQAGGKIYRIGVDMAKHDVDMHRFTDWWRRVRRTGYAYAEVSHLHANADLTLWKMEKYRSIMWGALLPIGIVIGIAWTWHALWLAALYPVKIVQIAIAHRDQVARPWMFALFLTISKFAEAAGILHYKAVSAFGSLRRKSLQINMWV